jgi:hypothetical protein
MRKALSGSKSSRSMLFPGVVNCIAGESWSVSNAAFSSSAKLFAALGNSQKQIFDKIFRNLH